MGEAQTKSCSQGNTTAEFDSQLQINTGGCPAANAGTNKGDSKGNPVASSAPEIALSLIACTAFIFLTSFAAIGLRGSDQYWYTAEVEHLLEGEINRGLVAFPFHAYNSLIPPPFNHHTLTHYIVLPFAKLFGAYYGWIISNALLSLFSAAFVGLTARKIVGDGAGVLAFATALLIPLAFWTTTQPYLDSSLAFFVAAGMYFYFSLPKDASFSSSVLGNFGGWCKLLLLFAVAYLCRVSFLPILILIPLGYLLHSKPINAQKVVAAIGMLLFIGSIITGYKAVFQPDPAMTLTRYLNANIHGVSDNMHVLNSLEDQPVELWKVWNKSVYGLWRQFVPKNLEANIFYLPFNLMLFCSLLMVATSLRQQKRDFRLSVVALAVLGMHIATICLRGNEFRFLHIVNPFVILGAIVFVCKWPFFLHRRNLLAFVSVAMILMSSVNLVLARRMREEVRNEGNTRVELSRTFDQNVPRDQTIVLGIEKFSEKNLMAGYAMRPRMVLFMRDTYNYSNEQIILMLRNVGAKWIFVKNDSPLLKIIPLEVDTLTVQGFPTPFIGYGLYKIAELEGL